MFPPDKCEFDNLANGAANITLFNYKWEYVTFVLYNTALVCGITTFIEAYRKTIVVGKHVHPNILAHTHQIVLFGINLEDIRNSLAWMEINQIDNTSKFVVVCESFRASDCDEYDAVNLLWEYKVTNVVFVNTIHATVSGYTYFFDAGCVNGPPIKVYDRFKYSQSNNYMFPVKFKNFHECPLVVSTMIQKPYMQIHDNLPSGADGDFLNIIVEAINASLKLMTPSKGVGWGYLSSNGTWVGSLRDLYDDIANISMTSASITSSRYRYFQISSNYNSVTIGWVTHPLKAEPASMKLLKPLRSKIRIAFVTSLVLTLVFIFILKQKRICFFRARSNFQRLPENILLQCWGMCMGQPILRMPKQMALVYLCAFWIWYCFLIRTFYQVYLITCLKNDFYLAGFNDLEEAISKGYPFGGGAALKDYFTEQPEIYYNWINVESNELYSTLTEMSAGKRFVLALNVAIAHAYLKDTKKKLFFLPGKIVNSHSVLFFKKYSPLADSLSDLLTRLFECGWPQKMYKDNTFQLFKSTRGTNSHQPINLQHFTGCYMILAMGWIISSGTFFLELCTRKLQRRG